ncbi:UDP-4-amino-4,6-dideoxy-N-acetyl-beta-L-altrosamine transaminase [Thalassobaculum sp. OXR-137]|uniref:UDP-4-amino-4, 6-dideoxy-N-acetyl-beta-L-altrosamine transaminase n=1 Tax=Thalassobaculum sp. OXR-137 TaxID=3100173 RepID=UPI002AC91C56|nr:UDP-4-amino-4,6-dideoxy-N-acetyl-beta-L-altrosamine transaminase [Thalassobaculum sp. OXR-137]WPZ36937.1 UDP-4-amino-4,6-dideoxy-N-acetyl-beta-L-altrosamine transaminase [Thalassobaculum sp. OXR-137]
MSVPPPFLPYGRQCIDEADIAAVAEVLRGDFLTTGPTVDAFEAAFAAAVNALYAVACSSGTAGLHLAMMALGVGPGDVVIVPTVTFLASANCAVYVGAEPVFADVDPDTGLTTLAAISEAVERAGRDRVKAIVAVHLNGHCVDVAALAQAFPEIPIVEDACHALGAANGGETVGACTHSAIAMFSTHPVKTVASGEGGVLCTRDPVLDERMRRHRNHGMVRDPARFTDREAAFDAAGEPNPWYYEMPEPGYNYRLSDIHAALGLSQIGRLSGFVDRRRHLRGLYETALGRCGPHVRALPTAPGCDPAWHLSVALIDFAALDTDRGTVMRRLRDEGIGTQVHYFPVHRQPYFRETAPTPALAGADRYYERCLSLPLFPAMADEDVGRVVAALSRSLGNGGAAG